MTSNIFKKMVAMCCAVILFCMGTFVVVLDEQFEKRKFDEMTVQAQLAAKGIAYGGIEFLESLEIENRVTWISQGGNVLFDTFADETNLENHWDREEVQEALKDGVGTAERVSKTADKYMLYYALRMEDGSVVRIACKKELVGAVVTAIFQNLVWMSAVLLVGCLLMAFHMSKKIVEPLNNISLERPMEHDVYPELKPLMERLEEQNLTIRSQMYEMGRKEQEFTTITAGMREGFVLFDTHGNILSYNQSAQELFMSVKHRNLDKAFPQLRNAVNLALIGQHWEGYWEQSERVYQCLISPVIQSGQVTGALLFMMDVTEKQKREQLRREFSANVSHELKTPLTSISGFAELMMNGMVPSDKIPECAGEIYKQSQQLINLVGDIIKISKLDEGSPLELERVDVYKAAQNVISRLIPAAQQQSVMINLRGKSCEIMGVPQIIDEMIYNLCDNAIKYNVPGGRIKVTVHPGKRTTAVIVEDTGIGIPYSEQSRVFERFYRVDKSHSKEIGGTGLGLSIVKHGAQYHGAEVSISSVPGKGTKVQILFRNDGPA